MQERAPTFVATPDHWLTQNIRSVLEELRMGFQVQQRIGLALADRHIAVVYVTLPGCTRAFLSTGIQLPEENAQQQICTVYLNTALSPQWRIEEHDQETLPDLFHASTKFQRDIARILTDPDGWCWATRSRSPIVLPT